MTRGDARRSGCPGSELVLPAGHRNVERLSIFREAKPCLPFTWACCSVEQVNADSLRLFVQYDAHKNTGAYFKFSDGANESGTTGIIHIDVDSAWEVVGMVNQPGAGRDRMATLDRRWLMPGRTIRIPNAAFTGWRVMSFWNIQLRIAMFVEIRTFALSGLMIFAVARLIDVD